MQIVACQIQFLYTANRALASQTFTQTTQADSSHSVACTYTPTTHPLPTSSRESESNNQNSLPLLHLGQGHSCAFIHLDHSTHLILTQTRRSTPLYYQSGKLASQLAIFLSLDLPPTQDVVRRHRSRGSEAHRYPWLYRSIQEQVESWNSTHTYGYLPV